MTRFVAGILFFLVALAAQAQGRELPDFADLVEKQGAAVVNVSTTQSGNGRLLPQLPQLDEDDPMFEFFRRFVPRQPGIPRAEPDSRSLGSGFVISPDGYVLTNAHVVESADEITVRLVDKREFRAKVIGADKRTDVAVIKIEASGLQTVRMGDPSRLRVGEWVVAIGSPFGFDNTVTAGIVSGKGRSLPQENFVPFIQTDVAINPGNSGGPLFNLKGEVVGINSQIYSRTGGFMGLSFAIPIDVAMDVQSQLRKHGRVQRGRIGVVIQEVTRELAESFGLERPTGALVSSVEKGGPADKAGLLSGDVITRFDGKTVAASSDLPRIVAAIKPGTQVQAGIWRKGAAKDLIITVGELSDDKVGRKSPGQRKDAQPAPANRFGLVLRDLTAEQKRELKVSGGVLVEDVRREGRTELRPGDVILSATVKGVTTEIKAVDQFNKLVGQGDKDVSVTLLIRRGDVQTFVTLRGGNGG